MRDIINFQKQIATGRFTLPVTILICLLLWAITLNEWNETGSLGIVALIGYLMIEVNTAFTLIRTRTSLPVCIYWILATILFFPHDFQWANLIPLAFLIAVMQLFQSYESSKPTTPIYNTFLILGTCSLFFAPTVYYIPLFFIYMIPFRAFSLKSFGACVLGIITPYWFLFGYAFWEEQMQLFTAPLKEIITFAPISYAHLHVNKIISWVFITLFLLINGIHYFQTAYSDKTRTRSYHFFLVYAGWWTTLLTVLVPQHLSVWIHIQCICAAFLGGHLFTLTRNRFSGIYFFVTFVIIILITLYNLWMLYFNS